MNAQTIEKIAADWLTRRTGENWSDTDQARLDAWLNQDLAHRIAYLRVESVWNEVGRLQVIRSGVHGTVPPRGEVLRWVPPASNPSGNSISRSTLTTEEAGNSARRKARGFAIGLAASMVVAIGGVWLYATGAFAQHRYTTEVGRIDTVALADGSRVILNTDSRIRVEITSKERRIALDRGEAFFEVAKDPVRPFVVDIDSRRVIAVGTQFSVRRIHDEIQVTVTEGAVRLDQAGGTPGSTDLLRAGSVAHTRNKTVVVERRPVPLTEESLSWRQGYLVFRDSALADAVREFNRYNSRKIVIADPSIATLQIGGHFRATSTDVFLWMLQNGFPVSVEESEGEVLLRKR